MSTRGRGSGGDHASRGIPRGQAQVGAFGRDDPQRGPSEREQVLFDAGEQLIIEVGEYGERQVRSRRRPGPPLCGDESVRLLRTETVSPERHDDD